jgi:hypothetical protein
MQITLNEKQVALLEEQYATARESVRYEYPTLLEFVSGRIDELVVAAAKKAIHNAALSLYKKNVASMKSRRSPKSKIISWGFEMELEPHEIAKISGFKLSEVQEIATARNSQVVAVPAPIVASGKDAANA